MIEENQLYAQEHDFLVKLIKSKSKKEQETIKRIIVTLNSAMERVDIENASSLKE